MVVLDQFMLFNESGAVLHLALASLWLIQCTITLPNKLAYDGSKIAKSAGIKINLVLSIINFFGAFYAQNSLAGQTLLWRCFKTAVFAKCTTKAGQLEF